MAFYYFFLVYATLSAGMCRMTFWLAEYHVHNDTYHIGVCSGLALCCLYSNANIGPLRPGCPGEKESEGRTK